MSFKEKFSDTLVVIRGAGDLATGIAIRFFMCGFPIIMLDIDQPTVIRRTVSFAQAMYDGQMTVEGVTAVLCSVAEAKEITKKGKIAIVKDPNADSIGFLKPSVVIDAILAKKNLGTTIDMAPCVVGIGPGFTAGLDCHAVVETQRGHTLGKAIYTGSAIPNTGIPGVIGNYGRERVMHTPCAGLFKANKKIGDIVKAGDTVAYVDETPVITEIDGKIRGMLMDGLYCPKHFKVADVDPRTDTDHTTCSDKARSIAGGALEAVLFTMVKVGL